MTTWMNLESITLKTVFLIEIELRLGAAERSRREGPQEGERMEGRALAATRTLQRILPCVGCLRGSVSVPDGWTCSGKIRK